MEFLKKLSFLASAGIETLPFGSKECYALFTCDIITGVLLAFFRACIKPNPNPSYPARFTEPKKSTKILMQIIF